jgi:hypothetical protein
MGWAGVGCEVEVSSLRLDTPTALVPVYNPNMKLTWDSSLNTPWSLLQLRVRILTAGLVAMLAPAACRRYHQDVEGCIHMSVHHCCLSLAW